MKNNILLLILILILGCVQKDENDFDINYPIPNIVSVSLHPKVGDTILINGTNFVPPNTLTIDGIGLKIVAENQTEIKAILPRIFNQDRLVVKNVYLMQSTEDVQIKPIFPSSNEIVVEQWPTVATRGRSLILRGKNVDLLKSVVIGSLTIPINGLAHTPNQVVVVMPKTFIPTEVIITATTMYGNTLQSALINVVDPTDLFVPVDPIVLLDFEDGNTHFIPGKVSSYSATINRSGINPAREKRFFSLYAQEIPSNWDHLGSIKLKFADAIDLIKFNDAHISFMINSADNVGYFQVKMVQDGKTAGSHFANGVTNNPDDAWMFRPTSGQWQWVSARLKDLLKENWGGNFTDFNPNGKIEEIELIFKQVNAGYWNGTNAGSENGHVNKVFKLNIDQVMITDGPIKPVYKLNDFEDQLTHFVPSANGQIADVAKIANNYVKPISGLQYFSVIKAHSLGWKWLGSCEFKGSYDLSNIADPYLSFWANTNNQAANLQFKFVQNGIAYGSSINTIDWKFTTQGWELKNLQLKEMQWDNWSGGNTKIDFNIPFSELTVGFSSGNVADLTYELHIDDIYISDGASF